MVKILTWNIARRASAWRALLDTDADIALLQEAKAPPPDVAKCIEVDTAPWQTAGAEKTRPWRTAVVNLSKRAQIEWIQSKTVEDAEPGDFAVSRMGTLAVAKVTIPSIEPFTVVSMYGSWENVHSSIGNSWIFADGSVHRLISDLSVFIGKQKDHRLLLAGDLNILNGYGENGSMYWASRYATIFDRMDALGLVYLGPKAPDGRLAEPWPAELPTNSKNVPTFHTNNQTPATATRQLDFVFASSGFAQQVNVRALNDPKQWGPSDHCQVEIEIT